MADSKVSINPQIEKSWKENLHDEFNKDYFGTLKLLLIQEKKHYKIYPPGREIFHAFNLTPFDNIKAVIIGQDPYHGSGQAEGLCFSVKRGIALPPSLQNIFIELQNDVGCSYPTHGSLVKWAKQGVLLLNAVLTVRANQAGSHRNLGWENFTDAVIARVSEVKKHLVFLLWGNFAKEKRKLINISKHLVLTAPHPSPLSVQRGFFGCRHFSKCNQYLQAHNIEPVDWQIL
jgi:uracil-DNA glycosylase